MTRRNAFSSPTNRYRSRSHCDRFNTDKILTDLAMIDRFDDDTGEFYLVEFDLFAEDLLSRQTLQDEIHRFFTWPRIGELVPTEMLNGQEPTPTLNAGSSGHQTAVPNESAHLAEDVFGHIQRIIARAREQSFALGEEVREAILRRNGGMHGLKEALSRFQTRRAALLMLTYPPIFHASVR